nr:MFS transporter [Microbacterium excoecariae]
MSGVLVAQFVANLSATIVATALPSIRLSLDGPAEHATWIVAATVLGNTASTPLWGKLLDRFSPKNMLLVAVALFALGSLIAGLAPHTGILIVGRAIQGVALGGVINANAIVVAGLVAARFRGKLNAWTSAVQTSATLAGPVAGGMLVEAPALGWRWAFFLSVPFALTAIVILFFTLPKLPAPATHGRGDILGGLLIGTTVTAGLIAVSIAPRAGEQPVVVWVSAAVALVGTILTVVVEARAPDPVIPLRFLRDPVVRGSALAALLVGTSMFSATVFAAQYLQLGVGISPTQSGLLLMPGAIATVIVNIAAGQFMARTGRVRPVLVFGTAALAVGNLVLALVFVEPIACVIAATVLITCGTGATLQNLVVTAQNVTDRANLGAVSALIVFGFVLGGTVGLVVFGTLLEALLGGPDPGLAGYNAAMFTVFGIGALVLVPAVVITIAMRPQILRGTMAPAPTAPETGAVPVVREAREG